MVPPDFGSVAAPLSKQDVSSAPDEVSGPIHLDGTTRALVGRLLRDYLRPHVGRIAVGLLCMAIVAASTAAFTQLIKPIIDDIFVNQREEVLLPVAIAALIVFAAKGLATYAQAVLMSFVGHRVVADLQQHLYERLIGADLAFFHRVSPGDLVARFINDINMLRNAVSTTLVGLGKDSLTALALVGVMFYEDWILALIAFVAFPAAVLPMVRIGRRVRNISADTQAEVSRLTVLLDESFQGMRYVKAYAMESYETLRARSVIDGVFHLNYRNARVRNILHPVMEILGGLAVVAVIIYGGQQVITQGKSPGSFFAFITALLLAYEPMKRLAKLNANLQEGLAAAERVFSLLDQEPEIREKPDAQPLKVTGGTLRFANVSFAYETGTAALIDVSLEVPAGRTAALVGASGAGKSTVLNLIPRFYDVSQGAVTIDDQDVRTVTMDSLRQQISLVSQEILLFDDTVRANIAYGRAGASDADVAAAAKAAGADEFITELPQGYDTQVGPRGAKLSGGQRQRIAIARAMLKNAPILLLDEATSSLDSESERQVQKAMSELMAGRTTLVIAHRLSTIVDTDVIFVMDGGRIVESGSHAELLDRGGPYARLYAAQFAEEDDSAAAEAARAHARAHARA
ncbi:MAG: ABC transporter ATP-binding protein [Alphaproteobacteria bacterium]